VIDLNLCRGDLLEFTRAMFKHRTNTEFLENWHQRVICDALEQTLTGQITRLIINIPPRMGKTELAVINYIAWAIGIAPDAEFIHASYSKRLAANNTYKVRELMQTRVYKRIFGYTHIKDDARARDEFRTSEGGVVYATGSEGTITGYGAGKLRDGYAGAVVIDDPHKASEAASPVARANVIDWFQTTMESRLNTRDTPIILIMQRLHEEDLSGFLLNGGNGEEWHHVCLPALDENDHPMWPERMSYDDLARLKQSNAYVFAGQQMQRPAPAGGGIFRESFWTYYDELPNKVQQVVIFADTAQKTGQHNDYSVFQCWALADNRAYLVDQIRGKWEAPELKVQAVAFWNKYRSATVKGVPPSALKIEDKSSGSSLIQELRRGTAIPVAGIPRDRDKVSRAHGAVPSIEAGNVLLPKHAPWLSDYLAEFASFTPLMTHAHDDQIDPTIDAIENLLLTGNVVDYSGLL